jgi:hypothetical protein
MMNIVFKEREDRKRKIVNGEISNTDDQNS